MSKRKIPSVNLNKAPTFKDFELGSILADIAANHYRRLERMRSKDDAKPYNEFLSDRLAQGIKDFRVSQKK